MLSPQLEARFSDVAAELVAAGGATQARRESLIKEVLLAVAGVLDSPYTDPDDRDREVEDVHAS